MVLDASLLNTHPWFIPYNANWSNPEKGVPCCPQRRLARTEANIDTRLTKAWTAIDKLSIIWKSDLTDKMKCSFFQAVVMLILLYGCTTWTLTKRMEKLDGNYTRMLRAILNKSWRQHPTKPQLYSHLPPITKTIKVRWTRHAGHCWRSRDKLINDVLLWTLSYGRTKAGRPARTYIQQLCEDTGCSPEDLPEVMNDREEWRGRVRYICAGGMTWWISSTSVFSYLQIHRKYVDFSFCFLFLFPLPKIKNTFLRAVSLESDYKK